MNVITLCGSTHKSKFDISTEIFVININNYIGNSTNNEIEYAKKNNRRIRYFTNECFDFYKWYWEYRNRNQSDWNI